MKIVLYISIGAVIIFIIITIYLYFNQKHMIFFPYKDIVNTPESLGLIYEDVYLEYDGGKKLHGWFIKSGINPESNKAILFCHGNAGNISHRLHTIEYLNAMGINVLIFDYPEYGFSEGELTESSIRKSSWLYYNWLIETQNIAPENIYIFGRSLGGAIAIDLASRVECAGVIAESSFTSVADMGKKIFPIFPIEWLLKYDFNSKKIIDKINCPVLIIHSPDDEIIPYQMGRDLFDKAKEPKQFIEIPGQHNDRSYFEHQEYKNNLRSFLGL